MATPDTQTGISKSIIQFFVEEHPEAEVNVRAVPGEGSLVVIAIKYLADDGNIRTVNVRSDPNS